MKTILFILISSLLMSCSARNIIELNPQGENVLLTDGMKIISAEDSTHLVLLNYEGQDNKFLVFYTEITNYSDYSIYINPEKFYYFSDDLSNVSYALNPKTQLESILKEDYNKTTSSDLMIGLSIVLGITQLAFDIDNNEKSEILADDLINLGENVIHSVEYSNEQSDYLNYKKEALKNDLLKSITLNPGEIANGLFYMKSPNSKEHLNVVIPFDDKEFTFIFNQEEI